MNRHTNLSQNSFGFATIVGTIAIICLLMWGTVGKATTEKPKRLGMWVSSPNIEVCKSSPIPLAKVEKAAQWWAKLGYVFGEVHPQRPNGPCTTGNMRNYITIDELTYSTSSPGITWLHVDNNQHISWAKIELESDRSRIIEHEIGHALGWSHVPYPGHMMNPNLELGGWNTQGLKLWHP